MGLIQICEQKNPLLQCQGVSSRKEGSESCSRQWLTEPKGQGCDVSRNVVVGAFRIVSAVRAGQGVGVDARFRTSRCSANVYTSVFTVVLIGNRECVFRNSPPNPTQPTHPTQPNPTQPNPTQPNPNNPHHTTPHHTTPHTKPNQTKPNKTKQMEKNEKMKKTMKNKEK